MGEPSAARTNVNITESTVRDVYVGDDNRATIDATVTGSQNVAVGQNIVQTINNFLRRTSEEERAANNRKAMARRVRGIWIDGVLKQSLYQEVLLEMRMEKRPAATPWGIVKWLPDGSMQQVPAGTSIVDLFEGADESLLILGAPGSGKSTTLLELTRCLLDRCDTDDSAPIPIVLNLSTWKSNDQSLADWVVDELSRFYNVPAKLGTSWVSDSSLALMLDGLDEVAEERRSDTVMAINHFLKQDFRLPVAVCCREAEYLALKEQITTGGAVCILPLSGKQIDDYLQGIDGNGTEEVKILIAQDAALRELAESPLLLNVMMLAAGDLRPAAIGDTETVDEARSRVYRGYVRAMLKRERVGILGKESLSKPSRNWQSTHIETNQYRYIDTVLWLQWLASKMTEREQTVFLLERMEKSWFNRRRQWLVWPMAFFMAFALTLLRGGGLFFVLGGWLTFGFTDINVRERISIRVKSIVIGVLIGALVVGLVVARNGGLLAGVVLGVGVGVFTTLSLGFVSLSTDLEATYQSGRPNAGITRLLKKGLAVGLAVGLVFGSIWIGLGLVFGLIAGLSFGLTDPVKHYLLRLVLWRDGSLPFRYVRFLDYCDEHVLLRRVGGGYMFIHRTFQDYMATVDIDQLDLNNL